MAFRSGFIHLMFAASSLGPGLQCLGQEANDSSISKKDSASYVASYWHNAKGIVTSPWHWNKEEWIVAGGAIAFTASTLALDEATNELMLRWNTKGAKKFGEIGDIIGGPLMQGGISAMAIMAGGITKSPEILHFGLDNLQAQAFVAGLALIVKNLSHRSRPEAGEGPFAWYGPFSGWGKESFFSGHTALSFCTANMLFLHSHKKWWVGVIGFGSAAAIGITRMQQQKHWASDVVMGAVIGSAVSTFVYKQQEKRRKVKKHLKPLPG